MRHIDLIVVHCADTPALMDIGVKEIREWHIEKGWSDVGYHYVIRRNGSIEKGRDDSTPGAHVRGFNKISLGICLVGGWKGNFDFTRKQMQALEGLLKELLEQYPRAIIKGHNQLDSDKACPGFDVEQWWYNGAWVG